MERLLWRLIDFITISRRSSHKNVYKILVKIFLRLLEWSHKIFIERHLARACRSLFIQEPPRASHNSLHTNIADEISTKKSINKPLGPLEAFTRTSTRSSSHGGLTSTHACGNTYKVLRLPRKWKSAWSLAPVTRKVRLTFQECRISGTCNTKKKGAGIKNRTRHAGENAPPQENFPSPVFVRGFLQKGMFFCAEMVNKMAGHAGMNPG